jgi:hypothetical protein
MRFWLVLAVSCGTREPAKLVAPPIASVPPVVSVAPMPRLPTTLAASNESREAAPTFTPAKGTFAMSCRDRNGVVAESPETTFAKCKPPSGSRFVIRQSGIVDRENADEKIAKCVQDELVRARAFRDGEYDCYVAFY